MKINSVISAWRALLLGLCLLSLSSCFFGGAKPKSTHQSRTAYFTPVAYTDIIHWHTDKHLDALAVFLKSCKEINKLTPNDNISKNSELGGKAREWQKVCHAAINANIDNSFEARMFFEKHFTPYSITDEQHLRLGKMTGYYEISMKGSRRKTDTYKYPIYGAPKNLEQLKGKHNFTHQAINDGLLKGKNLEIAWTDNKARAYFMQIQGSGIVILPDGSKMRLGYAGQNGHRYHSIGPEFKKYKTGRIESALDMIEWLHQNPRDGKKIMEMNPSYVFFKELKGVSAPIGAEGIPLTEHRSIAIDKFIYPYGTPMWIETTLPKTRNYTAKPFHRLFIAQDTGGAIKGAIRADLYFGYGRKAEERACYMNQKGEAYALFPKSVKIPKMYKS